MSIVVCIYITSISITPVAWIICLVVFQILRYSIKKMPHWFVFIIILLSNDIHVNPGPYCENNLKMNLNVNSLAKDNFQRVRLMEAHNATFNIHL